MNDIKRYLPPKGLSFSRHALLFWCRYKANRIWIWVRLTSGYECGILPYSPWIMFIKLGQNARSFGLQNNPRPWALTPAQTSLRVLWYDHTLSMFRSGEPLWPYIDALSFTINISIVRMRLSRDGCNACNWRQTMKLGGVRNCSSYCRHCLGYNVPDNRYSLMWYSKRFSFRALKKKRALHR